MKPLLKGLCIGFLLGIPLLAAGTFFYNQIPVISEPEDQERPVEEPVAEAPEPEPECDHAQSRRRFHHCRQRRLRPQGRAAAGRDAATRVAVC